MSSHKFRGAFFCHMPKLLFLLWTQSGWSLAAAGWYTCNPAPAAGGSVVDSPQCARQLLLKTTTDYGWGVVMILYQITYSFTLFFHTFVSHIKSMKYHTFLLLCSKAFASLHIGLIQLMPLPSMMTSSKRRKIERNRQLIARDFDMRSVYKARGI